MRGDEGFRNRRRLLEVKVRRSPRQRTLMHGDIFRMGSPTHKAHHAIPNLPELHRGSDFGNFACELQTGNVGWCAWWSRILPFSLQNVGPIQSGCPNTHKHF
jgi:hypothetical protein